MQGTTTNGTHLLPFKTGAFLAGAPVQPVILKYGEVSISFWLLASAALSCCSKSEGYSCTGTLQLTLDGHVWQGSVSPAWESISAPQHLFLLLANVCHSVTVYEVCALLLPLVIAGFTKPRISRKWHNFMSAQHQKHGQDNYLS